MKMFSLTKSHKKIFNSFIAKLENHRETNEMLVICPAPTKYSWLGVAVATESLFGDTQMQIPQYYTNTIFSEKQLTIISQKIDSLKYKQLILSGFPPYFEFLVNNLYKKVNIKVIYHGGFSELSANPLQIESFNKMLNLAKQKKINTLAFVKEGMGKTISELYRINCVDLVLPCYISGSPKTKSQKEIQIGCLVNNSFGKNLHNQVTAALMIENSKVHVFENNDLSYLPQQRIVQHKLMNHNDFIKLLGSMDINLHITYSESWGQVLAESIALGVPCLSAYTSAYFDYNDYLKKELIVEGFDDSYHIKNNIVKVLGNYENISKKCTHYNKYLNNIAQQKKIIFIDN